MSTQKIGKLAHRYIRLIGQELGVSAQLKHTDIMKAVATHFGIPILESKAEGHRLLWRYAREHHPTWKIDGPRGPSRSFKKNPQKHKTKQPAPLDVAGDDFLLSYAWRKLRMEVLLEQGSTCQCCGAQASRDRVKMNVDHIKPRRLYPGLALEKSNLQVLCADCNHGKGNWDQTDWRGEDSPQNIEENAMRPRLVKKVTVQ